MYREIKEPGTRVIRSKGDVWLSGDRTDQGTSGPGGSEDQGKGETRGLGGRWIRDQGMRGIRGPRDQGIRYSKPMSGDRGIKRPGNQGIRREREQGVCETKEKLTWRKGSAVQGTRKPGIRELESQDIRSRDQRIMEFRG